MLGKGKKTLFWASLLILPLIFSLLPRTYVNASDEQSLYVDSFDKTFTEWFEVPALNGSVYLDSINYPDEYIQSEGVPDQEEGWFAFENLYGEITSVWLETYCRKIEGNPTFTVIIDDGTGSTIQKNFAPLTSWTWVVWNITDHLDTTTKVNNAKVKFRSYRRYLTDYERSCDSFDDTKTGWERYGTSPYLKYPTSYVESEVNNDEIGDFGFLNISTELVTVSVAKLEIRSEQYIRGADDNIRIFIWDDSASAYVDLGTITPTSGWQTIDIFPWINTALDVNMAKIYLVHEAVGAVNLVRVSQAQLLVSYTQDGKQQIDCARLNVTYTPIEKIDCNWIGISNALAGGTTKFSSDWTDLNQSEGLSHNRFSTNNTGAWLNDTWTDLWENVVWAIATKTLNSTANLIIAFRFYVNDTSGTEYASTICFFITSSANYGFALDFDGIDDYVCVEHDASLNFGSGDFSVQLWLKTSSIAIGNGIINKWGSSGSDVGWFIVMTSAGKIRVYLDDGIDYIQPLTDESVNDGKWHMLTFTRGYWLKFYIDGEFVKQVNASMIDNIDENDPLLFGVLDSDTHSDWLNGTIDEPLFFSREINSTEITYSYNNGNGRYTPLNQDGIVAWYHFDEGKGTMISDETSNNNDGTLYGDTDEWVIGKIAKPLIPPKPQFFPYFGLGVLFALMIGLVVALAFASSKRK